MRRLFARAGLAAGLVLGAAVLTTPVAHADNCGSLQDCFYTISDAAQVVAGVTVLAAALALFLPGLLRTARTPAEAEKTASSEGSDGAGGPPDGARTAGSGPRHPGSGETSPQPLSTAPAQHPAVHHPSGTSPAQQDAASASGSAPNLPNLPDTPDVPESPEAFESLLAAQMGTRTASAADEAEELEAAEAEPHRAREYTASALAQMRALDVSSARVEEIIRRGAATAGQQPGTTLYATPEDDLLVTIDAITGAVLAVERRSV